MSARRFFLITTLLFAMVHPADSAQPAAANSGPLHVTLPDGWKMEYKSDEGLNFYAITPEEQGAGLLMFHKWPLPTRPEDIRNTVSRMAVDALKKLKAQPNVSLASESYLLESFAGPQCKGNYSLFHLKGVAGENVSAMFMMSVGDAVWNGQFTGAEELWPQALKMLVTLKPVAPAATASPAAHPAAKDRIVILITVDGFPAWIWKDPALAMPNLRRLAKEGATAGAMTVSNPSITWINHTTLVTGVTPRRHGVLFNGLLVRHGAQPPIIEPWRDKAELVHVPTVYDAAFKAGLKTAQVDWVAILNSGTINHEFLEIPNPEGPIARELVNAGVVTDDEVRNFMKGKNIVWRDWVWTQAGCHIIEAHKPNLLLFHLLGTDALNHQYGPGSVASFSAYAYADRLIGDLLASVERAGLRDRATVIVTTDHGFKKVSKVIYTNVALRQAGLLRLNGKKVESCDACAIAEGGMAFVYVNDPARRAELLPKLKTLCAGLEGVAQVVDGADGPKLGMPTPEENQGMGDLVLFAKPGYAFKDDSAAESPVAESKGYLGTHGYPASDPELDGMFIAWGCGIKPGARLERISNTDVAPTVAELLSLQLPNVEGRVLRELLR
jgi:predicted AlkP superfamily pyrophosphatase or phosphodiesterase